MQTGEHYRVAASCRKDRASCPERFLHCRNIEGKRCGIQGLIKRGALTQERITVKPKSILDPDGISVRMVNELNAITSLDFEKDGRAASVNLPFQLENLTLVETYVKSNLPNLVVEHSVVPFFGEEDYSKADFVSLLLPEIFVDDLSLQSDCDSCGRSFISLSSYHPVRFDGNTPREVFSVNGEAVIVSRQVMDAIDENITGASFFPFDENGSYFYLSSDVRLGPLTVLSEESIGFSEACPVCQTPTFQMFFGPFRFPRPTQQDLDVVFASFIDGCEFSNQAVQLLRCFEKEIEMDGVVLLN